MVGIIAILAISWLLLFLFEKKNILALGLAPTNKRIREFIYGLLSSATLFVLLQSFDVVLKSLQWSVNEETSANLFLNSLWWDVKSVLTEELLFRGALLYILIRKIGIQRSVLISSLAFGVYHLFSYGVFGNLIPMIVVLLGTGIMGYAWALAFSKTESIFLPFGLHLGWNAIHNSIFSKGPLGEIVLISSGGAELSGILSLVSFVIPMILAPLITLWYVRKFIPSEHKVIANTRP